MSYGSHNWSMSKNNLTEKWNLKMERILMNVKLEDKIRNETIRKKTGTADTAYCCKKTEMELGRTYQRILRRQVDKTSHGMIPARHETQKRKIRKMC